MKNNQQLFRELVHAFAAMGVDSPEAEARMVFEKIFGRDFKLLVLENFQVSDDDERKITEIIERRAKHEPIQYILGVAPFYNFDLLVNSSVLIPRPETEILVEYLINNIPRNGTLLDIGCGSGTIGVTVAFERSDVQVSALDISCDALEVAKLNAERHNIKNIRFTQSNLFENVTGKFDFIAANLPYIPENEYLECAPEVLNYEPQLALTAENEGLELIYKTAEAAPNFLNPSGEIIFENGHNQAEKIMAFLASLKSFSQISAISDYNNYLRFTRAKLSD